MRLLLAEDDEALRGLLARQLEREGYAVDTCANGREGMEMAEAAPYDGMILDIMMPEMDGLTLLSVVRSKGYSGSVLLLTARDAVEDRIAGLDAGADDYLVKPFSSGELSARVRAMLRRHIPDKNTVLKAGRLELDTVSHIVRNNGRRVELTGKEYALLEYMMMNRGRILTAEQILDHVWNFATGLDTNLVPVYIGYLRKKLETGPDAVRCIQTVRGIGYCLREDGDA